MVGRLQVDLGLEVGEVVSLEHKTQVVAGEIVGDVYSHDLPDHQW